MTVKAQAAAAPQLMEFLADVMTDTYFHSTFTEGYGEERAFADGKAKQAEKTFNILKGLLND